MATPPRMRQSRSRYLRGSDTSAGFRLAWVHGVVVVFDAFRLRFDSRLFVLVRLDESGNGAFRHAYDQPVGDLHPELVAVDLPDDAVEAARGDDLVAGLEALDQVALLGSLAALRTHDEQPEE